MGGRGASPAFAPSHRIQQWLSHGRAMFLLLVPRNPLRVYQTSIMSNHTSTEITCKQLLEPPREGGTRGPARGWLKACTTSWHQNKDRCSTHCPQPGLPVWHLAGQGCCRSKFGRGLLSTAAHSATQGTTPFF